MYQAARGLKAKLIQWYFRRFVAGMLLGNADFIALGTRLKQILLQINPNLKVHIVPNGIRQDWMQWNANTKEADGKRHFLFVGRYEWRKGIDSLHRVLKKLIEANEKNWDIHFVGDIPKEVQIASDRIFYHGMVRSANEIAVHYQAADVLICPSYSEGMPTVILEAMACGLAVIATDVGATSELVDENNGVLIAPFSDTALLESMERLLHLPGPALKMMKANSRQRVENEFTWSSVAQKHLMVFTEVAQAMEKKEKGS
jgi:glycosyltransferase involved in cell wall biosynthesis